jgi:hypothetical protein
MIAFHRKAKIIQEISATKKNTTKLIVSPGNSQDLQTVESTEAKTTCHTLIVITRILCKQLNKNYPTLTLPIFNHFLL